MQTSHSQSGPPDPYWHFIPPGRPAPEDPDDWLVVADEWDELGDEPKARVCRWVGTVLKTGDINQFLVPRQPDPKRKEPRSPDYRLRSLR